MHATDRIPGFAICARCGARRSLGPCGRCGILVCGDCRDERECAVCRAERMTAAERMERRRRLRDVGRRAAVVSLVAASGITGLSAAFVPPGPLCNGEMPPSAVEMQLLSASEPPGPLPLEATTPPPWTLTFRCVQMHSGFTCCVVDGR